ncbi:MAG: phytanoyl-CoA dioxygenase family protein [Acidimicrobiales bacterium]
MDDLVAARYRRDGHVVVASAVDDVFLRTALDHLASCPPPPNGLVAVSPDHDPIAAELGTDPGLTGLAAGLLGAEPRLFGFTYVVKPPRSPLMVLWHQDGHPWRERLGIEHALTLWVALDPATPDSGGLRVIPGSQSMGLHPLVARVDVANVFGWASDPALVDEVSAIDVELEPGDVSVHHPALLHASGPNHTDRRRAALGLRFRV